MTHISIANSNADVVHPGNMTQYYKLPVEYGGFCPMAVIKRGMIIPGDKNLGLIRYRDQLFSFASLDSAVEFIKNPVAFMEEIVTLAKIHPDYVQLLHLYKYFPTVEALETVVVV